MKSFDVICALATPQGVAGIAVVRISGENCLKVVDECFLGKQKLVSCPPNFIQYGKILNDKGDVVDNVLVSIFRAPHSYTGEDVVEISCHGGLVVVNLILDLLIIKGARFAEPGEFTKRAFLNQKMDLTQVEAVADLIHAVSKQGAQSAARQLSGGLTKKLELLREKIIEYCGLLELEIDFSHEDVELIDKQKLIQNIRSAEELCQGLINSYQASEIARSGYTVGIVGYPNVGKSSLLNALLDKKRAIVSETPGTTRDYLEEFLYINQVAFKIIDTAGLRKTTNTIEIEGIQLAEKKLEQCHLLIVLNDSSLGLEYSDMLLEELRSRYQGGEIVIVQNKSDLMDVKNFEDGLFVSAYTRFNIEKLKETLYTKATQNQQYLIDGLINARQLQLLHQTVISLEHSITSIQKGMSNEFVAIDLREALNYIGEITGAVWNEDILNAVFGKFCIGK